MRRSRSYSAALSSASVTTLISSLAKSISGCVNGTARVWWWNAITAMTSPLLTIGTTMSERMPSHPGLLVQTRVLGHVLHDDRSTFLDDGRVERELLGSEDVAGRGQLWSYRLPHDPRVPRTQHDAGGLGIQSLRGLDQTRDGVSR